MYIKCTFYITCYVHCMYICQNTPDDKNTSDDTFVAINWLLPDFYYKYSTLNVHLMYIQSTFNVHGMYITRPLSRHRIVHKMNSYVLLSCLVLACL